MGQEINARVKVEGSGYRLSFVLEAGLATGTYYLDESRDMWLPDNDVERIKRREPISETAEARQIVDEFRQQLMAMGYEPTGHGTRWFNYRFRRRVAPAM